MIYGLTQNGFRTKLYEDIFEEMKEEFLKDFPSANTRDDNPAIIFLKVSAMQAARLWESLESVYNSKYVSTAKGFSLDFLCKTIGISRRGKTPARGKVNIISKNNAVVNLPNKLIFESEYGTKYESVNFGGIVLDNTNNFACEVEVKSVDLGDKYNLEKGRIKNIIGSYEVEVTNNNPIIGGQDVEKDYELRQRYYDSVSKSGGANLKSIVAAVKQNTGAEKVVGLENSLDTHNEITNLPPHSVELIVKGGSDNDIANTIYQKKSAGVKSCGFDSLGNENKAIIIDGNEIRFTRPAVIELKVEVQLEVDSTKYSSEYTNIVKNNIYDYINSIEIGGVISYNKLLSKIYQNIDGIVNSLLIFGKLGEILGKKDIKVGIREFGSINKENIKIEIVYVG